MSLWPTSMLLGNSTGPAACWSGNHVQPLPGRAGWDVGSRPSAGLLLVADRHIRRGPDRLCAQTSGRNSVPPHDDYRTTAERFRAASPRHGRAYRSRPVSAAQRDPFSAEPLQYLPVRWPLSGETSIGRCRRGTTARSRTAWLA